MRAPAALCVAVILAACQPAGGPSVGATQPASDATTGSRLGAPEAGMPGSLSELQARGLPIAEEWQEKPTLVEVKVDLDADRRWTAARLHYVAADADRFLSLTTSGSGFTQERPSLAGLQLQPLTAQAVTQLPPFPADAVAPEAAAADEDVSGCGARGPVTVLYVTGAPYAWDGMTWTQPPRWRGIVTTVEGIGARVDLTTGAGQGCLE